MKASLSLLLIALAGASLAAPANTSNTFPTVDLGYVRQQATSETEQYYLFRNVRYAAAPIGELRFEKPGKPVQESGVVDGNYEWDTKCSSLDEDTGAVVGSEDCLFVDIYVPKSVTPDCEVPVVTWFHGGSYITGSKTAAGNPAGLFAQADEPFIFVAANYRLGAFGWLAPSNVSILPNLGLHDTRAALEWVQEHISAFGGSSSHLTAMGESAGSGLLAHTVVSNGGAGPALPFQQALFQSPGWFPELSPTGRDALWAAFAKFTNCSTVSCLQSASSSTLQAANVQTILAANNGDLGSNSGFMPVVDGEYVPATVPKLLATGKFHGLERVVSASTRWEGGVYLPENATDADVDMLIKSKIGSNAAIDAFYKGYYQEATATERAIDFISDIGFSCNGYWLSNAYSSVSRRYMFNLDTAYHGSDIPYTFYGGRDTSTTPEIVASDPMLAVEHQENIANYVLGYDLDYWPLWQGKEALWLNRTETELQLGTDYYGWETNSRRCDALLKGLYMA